MNNTTDARRVHNRSMILALFAALMIWTTYAGFGIWSYASQETEPPVFDALSYAQKAHTLWAAIDDGKLFNPFSIEPTIRPFGTVLLTYPFGYSDDFRGFYFRTMFIPMVLVAVAFLCVMSLRKLSTQQIVFIFVMAIAASSAPFYFQFQIKEEIHAVLGTWGFVDGFFGAIASLATAIAIRSCASDARILPWASALLAGFSLYVKPAGIMLMIIVGLVWLIITYPHKSKNAEESYAFRNGLIAFLVVYGLAFLSIYKSAYFAPEHAKYGLRGMELLQSMQPKLPSLTVVLEKFYVSIGPANTVLMIFGLIVSFRTGWRRYWLAATVVLLGGVWLWLVKTNVEHVRYFLPFQLMAMIVLTPPMVSAVKELSLRVLFPITATLMIPTVLIGYLLAADEPSEKLQKLAGVNLTTNLHSDVVAHARTLRDDLIAAKRGASIVYYAGTGPRIRAFEAVLDFDRIVGDSKANTIPALPIDWIREHAYRLDEIMRARYIVFEPVNDPSPILAERDPVDSFAREELMIRAWLSQLTEDDGVRLYSASSVRVVEIIDLMALDASAEKLYKKYVWREPFKNGYTQKIWVEMAKVADIKSNLLGKVIDLHLGDVRVAALHGIELLYQQAGPLLNIYVEHIESLNVGSSGDPWFLFVHLLYRDGAWKAEHHIPYDASAVKLGYARIYEVRLRQDELTNLNAIAIGVFSPMRSGHVHLSSEHGDWDGRRVVINCAPLSCLENQNEH